MTWTETRPTDFVCPGCGAHYRVVRVKGEVDPPGRLLLCTACKRPIKATDGEYMLKYFLVSRPRTKQPSAFGL